MNLEELTQRETDAFELYRDKYELQHTIPEPPSTRGLGWQFYLLVLTSLAAVILAALRTAEQFYLAASLSGSPIFSLAEAIAAMIAIEGGIVIYAAIRAENNKKVSNSTLGIGIFLMVLISTFAGLGQSLRLIDNINTELMIYFQYALSIVIGVGASALAWIGGEVLGSQIAKVGTYSEIAYDHYQQEVENYNNRLLASWNNSLERRSIRGDFVQSVQTPVPRYNEGTAEVPKTQVVYQWLDDMNSGWTHVDDVPSAREIEKELEHHKVAVSSAQRGRNRWIRENLNGR